MTIAEYTREASIEKIVKKRELLELKAEKKSARLSALRADKELGL